MFGFGQNKRQLSAHEVAQWLTQHARDVRANSLEDASTYAAAAQLLATEHERRVALINDFLAQ